MQLVIRTIYSVYLSTKRPNVQKISRGSLVHIVQLCQERLERFGGHAGHLLPGSPRGHSEAGSPRHAVPVCWDVFSLVRLLHGLLALAQVEQNSCTKN